MQSLRNRVRTPHSMRTSEKDRFKPMSQAKATAPRVLALTTLVAAMTATAADHVRHVDAHVHGQGALNFAVEGSQLHMELVMPAHDILGFESIVTESQKQQLHSALAKLESEELWQPTPAARCQLVEVSASAEGHEGHGDHDSHDHEEHHDEKGHHDHDHDEHHDEKDHHDHGHDEHHAEKGHHDHDEHHDHDSHNHGESNHFDISAHYVFECQDASKLNSLGTQMFETFERSKNIRVQGFTEQGQIASDLNSDKPEVRF